MVLASTSPNSSPKPEIRKSLKLTAAVNHWWENQVMRIKKVERLQRFSFTGLLYRIADADLDFTNDGIMQYQETSSRKRNKNRIHKRPSQIPRPRF